MKILVTGAAGFIGAALSQRLLTLGHSIVTVDSFTPYYDVQLKKARVELLKKNKDFKIFESDISDNNSLKKIFEKEKPEVVVNLAAQVGVRYSLENPHAYVNANLVGFVNILEQCRHFGIKHLVYASSSSVYGANTNMPFLEEKISDHPISLYGATKRANELLAHSYSALFKLPTTGLRFFTVYGPWGRPDMALFQFTKNILTGIPIQVFNHGKHKRDFTYIDDIVEGIVRVIDSPAKPDLKWDSNSPIPSKSFAPFKIYNIGHSKPEELMRYIQVLEQALGKKAEMKMLPHQPGDVPDTFASVEALATDFDYKPKVSIETGIQNFVAWYREYYSV